MSFIVAVDGPCGSGKGTITKRVQNRMSLMSLDSGILYRCVTLEAINNDLNETNVEQVLKLLDYIDIQIENTNELDIVYLNGNDVTARIRDFDVSTLVSKISPIIPLRERIIAFQHKLSDGKNVIVEGRDTGTVVYPNANVKIFLDADVEVRARRRYEEYIKNGNYISYDDVLDSMRKRDSDDYHRPFGALKKAEDAILVDSTSMTIDEVVDHICDLINEKMNVKN